MRPSRASASNQMGVHSFGVPRYRLGIPSTIAGTPAAVQTRASGEAKALAYVKLRGFREAQRLAQSRLGACAESPGAHHHALIAQSNGLVLSDSVAEIGSTTMTEST